MFSLRTAIALLVVFTQVWTPVLSQTLPISVDKSVAGQRPVVGVSGNGVPIVNIAPPSASGVSNNRYTQFNVGPSGVVLNNSGAGSQSQLAGAIGGNPMLGNGRATTILNQVTANNPSQLRGFMEVAGNRANVIVANPAGITCDGCGFLNANRGTLTTGLPMLGPDGSVQGFDVTRGRIAVEGNGLYGDNLDQVDLIARSLTLNASVWANRLSVVAGPATVSYGDGTVQGRAGEDAAPAVSLDMAALGGMYANSIRLIGTEAGVGVNIGGNLTAMTGDLEVSAAGDVRILPAGKAQAAGNLRMDSAGAIGVDGIATAGSGMTLSAAGNVTTSNTVNANGDLRVTAGGAMALGGTVGSGGSAAFTSAGSLSTGNSVNANGDLRMSAGGAMTLGGTVGSSGRATFTSAGDLATSNTIIANGNLQMDAARAMAIGGKVAAGGDIVLGAASDVSVSNAIGAVGGMVVSTGGSVVQSGTGSLQANSGLTVTTGGSLTLAGMTSSQGGITLQSGGTTHINGLVSAGQGLGLVAGGNLLQGRSGRIEATGSISGASAAGINLAGTTVAQSGITLQSTAAMAIDGQLTTGQALALNAGGDLTQAAGGNVQTDGRFTGLSGGAISLAGSSAALDDLMLTSRNGMTIAGQVATGRNATLTVGGDLGTGSASKVQADGQIYAAANNVAIGGLLGTTGANGANGLLTVNAAQDMTVTGTVSSAAPLNVTVGRNLAVGGTLLATGGGLSVSSGQDTSVSAAGRVQSTDDLVLQSGGKLIASGIVSSNNAVRITADGDARVDGIVAALGGGLSLIGKNDLTVGSAGRVQAATTMTAQAGRDMVLAGSLSSVQTLTLNAVRDVRIDGIAATDAGLTVGGRDLTVGATGVAQAASGMTMQAAGALGSAGRIVSDGTVTLQSAGNLVLSGTTASTSGDVKLSSTGGDLTLGGAAKTQAAGLLDASAARDLSVAGTTSSNGAITLSAARDVTLGGITAALGGDLRMDAGSAAVVAADGRAQAARALTLNAGTTLRNEGLLSAGTDGTLSGAGGLTNVGTAVAAQDLKVSTLGAFSNTGSLLAGLNDQGQVALPGSLSLSGGSLVNSGLAAAGKNVTLDAASLTLNGGTVSANQALSAVTLGDIAARGATLYGGTVSLSGVSLDNSNGSLSSNGDLTLVFSGILNNQAGSIATNGALNVGGSQILNQGGKMLAQDLKLTSPGVVNNTGGLLQGANTLTLSAGSLVNIDTPSADPTRALGVVGKTVVLNAASIDNTRGTLAASDALTLGTTLLQNASGLVTSGGTADITAGTLANEGGNVVAGTRLSMILNALSGTGTLQSQGDLSLAMSGGLINTGSVVAARDATLSIAGDLDNRGKISAGRNLTVGASSLTNEASGEIVSNGVTTLNVTNALNNAGLIDGAITHIQAGSVLNTGRLYGDTLAISAGYLRNDVGASGAGVIASRGNMDLGVGTLDNLEHGLIYAAGDLGIGGALDGLWRATGQAQAINNASATIEAGGNAAISAAAINNINNHYASEVVQVSAGDKVYYRLNGTTDLLDGATYWLCDQTTAMCSKDPAWLEDDQERRLLLPSSTYPESQYGPPFDYALGGHGEKGRDAPIARPYTPPSENCGGSGDSGTSCEPIPERFLQGTEGRIWDVFGVTRPAPLPTNPADVENCGSEAQCQAMQTAYDQAHAAFVAAYEELNARVLAYNQDFNNRLVKDFTIYEVTQTVTETRTTATDPGKIIAAGNATLTGTVLNDKSQIVAGGALTVTGPAVQNIGAVGERRIDAVGSEIYTYEKNDDRKYDTVPYSGTISTEPIGVPVGSYGGGVASPSSGAVAPGASAPVSAAAPIVVNSVQLPGSGIVRTVTPPSSVPNSQLYTVVPAATSPYLVTTDSRFTGNKPTISSDYLLALLDAGGSVQGAGSVIRPASSFGGTTTGSPTGGASPTQAAIGAVQIGAASGGGAAAGGTTVTDAGTNPYLQSTDTLKRLGDGFYEQKLVTDQIIAATGQRFVGDYTDNETQYKDLLTAGATFAQQYGLQVGTPLSEDQMKQLTTDMVWLVDQTVTLADGSTQTVLVPQVYLVVQDGDLKGDGTLMAGRSTTLTVDGSISNTGTIGSRDATVMVADNILNQAGGVIQGSIVDLNARQDLNNIAALIKGDAVALQAGRDINLTSTTASVSATVGPTSTWSTFVSGVSAVDAGSLMVNAGRDLNLTAAALDIKDSGHLQAGNDINLLTAGIEQGESVVYKKRNSSDVDRQSEVGTTIQVGGDLTLVAGRDVTATAANVTSDGQIAVGAGRDINIVAGEASGYARDEHYQKFKGLWGRTTTHESVDTGVWSQGQASTFTGDSIVFSAGQDINVIGSNVGATNNLTMSATRSVTIAAAENTSYDDHYYRAKTSGWGAFGFLSKGTKDRTDTLDGTTVFHTGSTVGSVQGDVLINAGEHLQVVGSNIVAKQGDIALLGGDVTIASLNDTNQEHEYHEVRRSGFSVNFDSPLIDTMHTMERMSHAESEVDNPILKALAFTTIGLAGYNALDNQGAGVAESSASATITLNYGASRSRSTTDRASSTVFGSTVAAGNNLTIVARGNGADSYINVLGSRLSAGNNAVLKADGDITLQAAANTDSQHTETSHVDGSIGAGVMVGAGSNGWGYGFVVKGSVAGSRGKEDGSNLTWTNSSATAGNTLVLQSGGDTSLIGATGKADQIIASVGGDLYLRSLQDKSTYDSKDQNFSAGFTFCWPYCSSSAYVSAGQGALKSNWESVPQQTGLFAGDGGFLIEVKDNTTLIGSVIGSSDKAVSDGANQLTTGTLLTESIRNTADYWGYQVGISGGTSGSGSQNIGGQRIPTKTGGAAAGPTLAAAFGSANSSTDSAISGGTIVIRDAEGQLQLTGKTVDETIASLTRDVSDTLDDLEPIFDRDKVLAGFEIVTTAQQQYGVYLAKRQAEIARLEAKAGDTSLTQAERDKAGAQASQLKDIYSFGKYPRIILDSLMGGVAGNVSGTPVAMLQGAAVNFLQSLAAEKVKEISNSLGKGVEADAVRAALHAIVGCAGAAAANASCGAGALGAGASSIIASLMKLDADGMTDQERESARNLITSIVAGIAGTVSMDIVVSANAAATELSNNALTLSQFKRLIEEVKTCKALNNCDAVRERYRQLSMDQQMELISICAMDRSACGATYGEFVTQIDDFRIALEQLHSLDLPKGFQEDLFFYRLNLTEATSVIVIDKVAEDLAQRYGIEWTAQKSAMVTAAFGALTRGAKGVPANVFPGVTSMLNGVKVTDKLTGITYEGTVNLLPTFERIAAGIKFPSKNDGTVFKNMKSPLPAQPLGYYTEYVVPTPGVVGPGPQRVVTGKGGEVYYTPDHYDTFIPLH
ncbi:two-partner secretion domain-containing protein [Achromobacter aloeverae]|uniref:Filamentous hemagglutinin n=1 Tax=Achromobacter aloeverae TaxID=1750518 RepID=A0A4Q1HPR5_9BURK|nr:hemagglutinin repeat-containing protein [Achromobacter aloeverae]RXN92827.1 filamentous hemagglutinin [Achromobacter aloeverae]